MEYFSVHIFSSRSHQPGGREAMKNYLLKYLDASIVDKIQFPTEKPPAHLAIDDRAMMFEGTFPDPESLLSFKPWNRK